MTQLEASQTEVGARVQAATWTDRWMMGDRFGTVERVGRNAILHVRMDRSGKLVAFAPCNVEFVA